MGASRLPALKTLADSTSATAHHQAEATRRLYELGFVERNENIVFLGPRGAGKKHLSTSPTIAAAEGGRRVYPGTLTGLINFLENASDPWHSQPTPQDPIPLRAPYRRRNRQPPGDPKRLHPLQLVNPCHEYAPSVLTSNKGFEE